ncbi:MAG: hypothetical protein UY60_C0029G0009 [Parcubacteria group bacterium GW2011_GWB1_50_9]|uniref:Uncharacterized protein n=1 Tax=Candidatus Adlerbacteria bacterium GW2011_GWC1_50_9 TaxID=1618608 RepID=A0A0G1WLB9_9BACT|nr:MAG: hypothetical protein UY60_C0029G0009 [Parcubacteria group bacterium GW2011_GWB1_50_9]KKW19603.1 MAG: hypothetical protein UY61_C0053G0004 [Candidatus Adlerbacteria bacterium GW2011_GWC1_50_9]
MDYEVSHCRKSICARRPIPGRVRLMHERRDAPLLLMRKFPYVYSANLHCLQKVLSGEKPHPGGENVPSLPGKNRDLTLFFAVFLSIETREFDHPLS